MQMQWLNILASIFQNIWDPEKMRIKVKAHCFFFRLDKNSIRFSWFNDNSILWRTNLAILARELGFKDFSDFSARFGSGWAYHLAPVIKDVGSYERYQVINGQITDRSTGEVLFRHR